MLALPLIHNLVQDLSGLLKDISNADDGKIESRLTLRVNCSTGKGGRWEVLLQQNRDAESKR